MDDLEESQRTLCARIGAPFSPVDWSMKIGVARNFATMFPGNGLRHPPANGTLGWYLWSGEELPSGPDFFQPMHAYHLRDRFPFVARFLALPPGWRFLIAPGHEDVWYDAKLLDI